MTGAKTVSVWAPAWAVTTRRRLRKPSRQLIVESLVLAVPAAATGLAFIIVTARVFPAVILATFPAGVAPVENILPGAPTTDPRCWGLRVALSKHTKCFIKYFT